MKRSKILALVAGGAVALGAARAEHVERLPSLPIHRSLLEAYAPEVHAPEAETPPRMKRVLPPMNEPRKEPPPLAESSQAKSYLLAMADVAPANAVQPIPDRVETGLPNAEVRARAEAPLGANAAIVDGAAADKAKANVAEQPAVIHTTPGPLEEAGWNRVPARISLRHDFGEGVGFDSGYTYLEAFVPVWQPSDRSVFFLDGRVVNFDDRDRWEFNLGGGARAYAPALNCVLGVNAFYDARHTETNYFQQIGIGLEALGKVLEARVNGYFIVGYDKRLISDSGNVFQGVVGNNIVLNQTQVYEVARGGIEAEVGAPIPLLDRFYTRAYIGVYSYGAEGEQNANGVRARIESQLSHRISLHLAVQNDRVFDTTCTGGLAISFGAPAFRSRNSGRPTWQDVLGQRVHRDVNVVISQGTQTTQTFQALPPPPPPPPPPQEPSPEEPPPEGGLR